MKRKPIEDYIQKIRDLKAEHRLELLALRKIDVPKVDSLQVKYDKLMAAALENIGKEIAEGAEERKAKQLKILSEIQKFPKEDRIIVEIGPTAVRGPVPPEKQLGLLCCNYLQTLFNAELCDHLISPSTGTVLDGNKASVTCDVALNSCYPYLELHGGGADVSRELKVDGWCSFTFIPTKTGTYCIEPFIMVNGYYLFQTWGSCAGGVVSNATLKIKAIITVKQVGMVVDQWKVPVYEHTSSDGQFSPIDYSHVIHESVRLDYAGNTATIEVGIEVEVIITGNGQVIVDIQKNPNFYFRVPYIDIYRKESCWKKWMEAYAQG